MNKYRSEFYVKSDSNDKIFVGDHVRCSYNTSSKWSGGCWHGKITCITSRGIYIDVGNKRDKYVCFVNMQKLSLTF